MQDSQNKIQQAGLRPTPQRLLIADVIFGGLNHPTAEDVLRNLSSKQTYVSQATVYNTLHAFVEGGLLQEVYLGDGRTVYDHNVQPHHHFIDEETQSVIDIDIADVKLSQECLSRFDIDSVQMVIRGKQKPDEGRPESKQSSRLVD